MIDDNDFYLVTGLFILESHAGSGVFHFVGGDSVGDLIAAGSHFMPEAVFAPLSERFISRFTFPLRYKAGYGTCQ